MDHSSYSSPPPVDSPTATPVIHSCGFGQSSASSFALPQRRTFASCCVGDVQVPVAHDGTLRTVYHGVTVVIIDAQQWRLDPRARYTSESFRMLPAMRAKPNSPGIDIMFHTIEYLDLLRQTTGRVSPVDGDLLVSVCNIPGLNNAFWTGNGSLGHMIYGNGDGIAMKELVAADVVAHELTHALTETLCGLVYKGESGALNESISDCFGTACESREYAKYNTDANLNNDLLGVPDWLIGEDVVLNINGRRKLRDMSHPESCEQPSRYGEGKYWCDPANIQRDHGGVHINSGVPNKFFYLLCSRHKSMLGPLALLVRVMYACGPNTTMAQFAEHCRQQTTVAMHTIVHQSLVDVGL